MAKDPRNPTGSDIVAERLRKGGKGKKAPKKKRQKLISFEVTTHKHHTKQNVGRELEKKGAKEKRAKTHTIPTWRRVAVFVFIILLIMWYFTNNYMKNVKIEELQSANEEFAQAYDEQAQRIMELEAEVDGLKGGS